MKIAVCMMHCLGVSYGSVKAAISLANELARKNHEVYFLCYDETKKPLEFALDPGIRFTNLANIRPVNLLRICVPVIKILYNIPSLLPVFLYEYIGEPLYQFRWYVQNNISAFWAWKTAFDRGAYDVVCIHGSDAIAVIPFVVNRRKSKLIITLHSQPEAEIEKFSLNRVILHKKIKGLNKADKITVLQKKFVTEAAKYCKNIDKLIYIPNFIYGIKGDEKKLLRDHVNIIAIGNLVKEKNFDLLIQALSMVKSKNWTCNIWGKDCGEKNKLKKAIKTNKLETQVFLKGFTHSIAHEIEKSHLIVQPSFFEGFPLAVSEAMIRGVVPIGFSSCPGINDLIVDHYNGLLARKNDARSLAGVIDYAISNPDVYEQLSINAKETIKKYSPENVMPEWERIING